MAYPRREEKIVNQVPARGFSLERMVSAVEKVRQRLLRAASALEKGGVAYAVVGENAVAAWVSTIDESAVRNTQDVDMLIRRCDLDAASNALSEVGFIRKHCSRLPDYLAERLQELLDNPNG